MKFLLLCCLIANVKSDFSPGAFGPGTFGPAPKKEDYPFENELSEATDFALLVAGAMLTARTLLTLTKAHAFLIGYAFLGVVVLPIPYLMM